MSDTRSVPTPHAPGEEDTDLVCGSLYREVAAERARLRVDLASARADVIAEVVAWLHKSAESAAAERIERDFGAGDATWDDRLTHAQNVGEEPPL